MTVERAVPGEKHWPELSAPHMARYLAAAEFARGRRVLDAGCGAGYGASMLMAAGAASVHGVDVDLDAVLWSRHNFAAASITFGVDDCQRLQTVSGTWDLICCFEVIEHLTDPGQFLDRAAELLAAEGLLIVSTPERSSTPPFVDGRPRNRFHVHEWYRDEFADLLRRRFAAVDMRVQVESTSLRSRMDAVGALRQGLMLGNPLLAFAWRKWPFKHKEDRAWTKLAGLAVPSIADFPVVPASLAPAYGMPRFNVAICRQPIKDAAARQP